MDEQFVRFYRYRQKAWQIMKSQYFILLSAVLAGAILTGELIQFAFLLNENNEIDSVYLMVLQRPLLSYTVEQWLAMRSYIAIAAGIMVLVRFLFINVINYGVMNVFRFAEKKERGSVFMGFGKNYLQIVHTKLLADLRVVLRLFLLVVPGIKEHYSYYFLDYALYDYPDKSPEEILRAVKNCSEGRRMNYFRFDLMFFGWYVGSYYLNIYLFGLATALVRPYILEARYVYYDEEGRFPIDGVLNPIPQIKEELTELPERLDDGA